MMGFFDKEETSTTLSKLGNPLEKLHKAIDFEMFRSLLENHLLNQTKTSKAGCKPYDVVMMFKIILLKFPVSATAKRRTQPRLMQGVN